ncbi:RNA-binding protein 34 [Galdieria sulphuraria]|nr:RNA-binding protein 34 [Galdieria sulphuraria]
MKWSGTKVRFGNNPKSQSDDRLARTIFVGNVPLQTRREKLIKFFKNCGPIESRAAVLSVAVDIALSLNGSVFQNKHLKIDRDERPTVSVGYCIFVGNLPFDVEDEQRQTYWVWKGFWLLKDRVVRIFRCKNSEKLNIQRTSQKYIPENRKQEKKRKKRGKKGLESSIKKIHIESWR